MAAYISGSIHDIYDNGVKNALIECEKSSGGIYSDVAYGSSSYSIQVIPGIWEVRVYHSGCLVATSSGISVSAGEWHDEDFTPASGNPLRGIIKGYVYDENDDPVENTYVWGKLISGSYDYGVLTQDNGYYELYLYTLGTYEIIAGKNNYNIRSHGDHNYLTMHPTYATTMNFTSSYYLERKDYGTTNIAIEGRSVGIVDDFYNMDGYIPSGMYNQITADTTNVYAKGRRIGTGGSHGTSSGWGDGKLGHGSGGTPTDGFPGGE